MSLLIKALQKAEQQKEAVTAARPAPNSALSLELEPQPVETSADDLLAEESGFEPNKKVASPFLKGYAAATSPLGAAVGNETRETATSLPEPDPERAAASSILQAGNISAEPARKRAIWLGLGGLGLLLLVGTGFYFYLQSLQQPEIVIARPVQQQPVASVPEPVIQQPPTPSVPPATPQTGSIDIPTGNPAEQDSKTSEPQSTKAGPIRKPEIEPPTAPEPSKQPVVEKPMVSASEASKPKTTTSSVGTSKVDSGSSNVNVKRNRKSEPTVDATALAAYQAFTAGDLEAARRLYQQMLQSEPHNLDAMLGLAAVAVRQAKDDEAASLYLRVLEQDPRNSIAQAGLVAMTGVAEPVIAESRLKSLLVQQPEASYLHAALGNLYADQNQWSNAQQAYFQAFRLDSANAENAFNLAVSLDHLGKKDLALDYYQRAVALLPQQGGTVDRQALQSRILQLQSLVGK